MIEHNINIRKQTNAFAMYYGLVFGIIWCILFFMLVSPQEVLRTLAGLLFFSVPFIGFFIARHFRKTVKNDGEINYWRGFWFSLLMYIYASAILALFAYLYFRFLDNGAFVESNLKVLSRPEIKKLLEQSVISEDRNAYDEMLSALQNITPLAVTASVINFSSFVSIPLALVTSLFAMTRKRKL